MFLQNDASKNTHNIDRRQPSLLKYKPIYSQRTIWRRQRSFLMYYQIYSYEKTLVLYTYTGPTLYSRFCSRAKGSPFPSQQLRSSHGSKVDGARLEPWLFLCTQPLLYLALTSDFVLYFTKHITNIMTLYYMFIS